ncbi:YdhK family protein [Brevibacterium marinum]|uniref:DUF1541 domain-containing protein n=1 Tax=Brevibacterium marinum TaxID=418643 RepID=A0A846RZQ4_9MICO|nr:YdhK family protein [Brevibacterium marinum]NJC55441.1 hypothetical protein [Brevibacterium marinum]
MTTSTVFATAAVIAAAALTLTGCAGPAEDESAQPSQNQTQSASSSGESGSSSGESASSSGGGHEHASDGGQPPEGIEKASDPKFAVGDDVVLSADHMPGMKGADATITGAFDTTAYAVSYTPTDGGDPVKNHKWVVHEELDDPGSAPLKDGTKVTLEAEHMPGMKGAKATIDGSTDETVYMVDVDTGDMTMTNHKWVVEDEAQPAK